MRRKRLDSISDITDAVIRRADLKKKRYGARAALVWEKVAGAEIARHTLATSVREGEFVVSVDSAAWASQLDLMKDHFLDSIRSELGKDAVRSMRFTVSKRVATARAEKRIESEAEEFYRPDTTPSVPLDENEVRQAEYIAGAVKDAGLRETALRVMIKDLEWKKGARAGNEPQARSDGPTGDTSTG